MSPCNHSNFPGALWRTDNSVRGVPFLFFTPPSLSLVLTSTPLLGSLLDPCILRDFPWLDRPVFVPFMCALKFESQPSERLLQTTVAIIACCYLSESLVWTLRTIWGLYFCVSRRLFCVGTERNVLQRHCLSPWFLCLHFRGCAVKPWCCPREQSPWEYAMLNSKYNQIFSNFLCLCVQVTRKHAYMLGFSCSICGCLWTWATEIFWKFNGMCWRLYIQ